MILYVIIVIAVLTAVVIFALKSYQPQYEPSLSPPLNTQVTIDPTDGCPTSKPVQSAGIYDSRGGLTCRAAITQDEHDDAFDLCYDYCHQKITCTGDVTYLDYCEEEVSAHGINGDYGIITRNWRCDCTPISSYGSPIPGASASASSSPKLA